MWCCSNLEAPDPPSDIHLPIGSFGGQRGIALQKSPKKKHQALGKKQETRSNFLTEALSTSFVKIRKSKDSNIQPQPGLAGRTLSLCADLGPPLDSLESLHTKKPKKKGADPSKSRVNGAEAPLMTQETCKATQEHARPICD